MKIKPVLLVDASVNLVLGVVLLAFGTPAVQSLGIPPASSAFYPNILGGVFIGVTLALVVEALRQRPQAPAGLGAVGASCINLCGGVTLVAWLLFGGLVLRPLARVLLWGLAAILVVLSGVELAEALLRRRRAA
jgi:hypothetical protein